jgi:hypothetical protein
MRRALGQLAENGMKYEREARQLNGLLFTLGYTRSHAADELGYSERMFGLFCSGATKIPLSVFTAIKKLKSTKS